MVMALSGAVIMDVKGRGEETRVIYYRKCNHCQTSEYEKKPYLEAPWVDTGISTHGEFECPKCNKKSEIKLKFSQ